MRSANRRPHSSERRGGVPDRQLSEPISFASTSASLEPVRSHSGSAAVGRGKRGGMEAAPSRRGLPEAKGQGWDGGMMRLGVDGGPGLGGPGARPGRGLGRGLLGPRAGSRWDLGLGLDVVPDGARLGCQPGDGAQPRLWAGLGPGPWAWVEALATSWLWARTCPWLVVRAGPGFKSLVSPRNHRPPSKLALDRAWPAPQLPPSYPDDPIPPPPRTTPKPSVLPSTPPSHSLPHVFASQAV